MKNKKIILLMMVIIMSICGAACSNSGTGEESKKLPEYSGGKQFDFFGYTSPTDGTYVIDGITYDSGEDFRTVERFKEYKDVGMTMIMARYENSYSGEAWATSNTKKYFDNAYAAGIDKIIVTDNRLNALITTKPPVGAQFASAAELEAYVAACLDVYKDAPGFYGVVLMDEPTHLYFEAYGQVYRAVKKYLPDIYIHANLYPMGPAGDLYAPAGTYTDLSEAYTYYVTEFLDATDADVLCFDSYPFKSDALKTYHFTGLQISAEICAKRGIKLHAVAQTGETLQKGAGYLRNCNNSDMYWQLNTYAGFGVSNISYFTYMTKQQNDFTDGESYVDGTSFLWRNGDKTPLYDQMKKMHGEFQSFADVILSFKYSASRLFVKTPSNYNTTTHTLLFKNNELKHLKEASADNDVMLTTELYDAKNDRYMYMVQNVINPTNSLSGRTSMSATLTFDSKFSYAAVYECGEAKVVKLNDGKYTTALSAGYAQYLIPLEE